MSSDVKRYDPINSDGTCGMCIEDADYGAYVEYADYAALEAELAKLRAGQEPVAYRVNLPPQCTDKGYHVKYRAGWNNCLSSVLRLNQAPQLSAVPDAITMADVMRAWEYAEDHPHKYLRGTTNWCAAVAHSLNQRNPSAPVQGDEAGETRRVCHACATWSRNKACPVCDPQMSHMTLQLLEALEGLVNVNEQHNAAIQRVTGTPAGWKDDYLNQARAAIAAARQEGGKI